MPVSALDLALAASVVASAAFFQGLVGIGFNIIAVPILLLIDPILAPVPNLLLALPLTIGQMARERTEINWPGVKWILVGRIPGGLAGLGLLIVLSATATNIALALLILTIVALLASGVRIQRNPSTEFTAGFFSGVAGIVGAAGGPPVGLLYKDTPPAVVRSTLGVVFSIGLMMSIGLRLAGGKFALSDLQVALWLLPAMTVGFLASNRARSRVDGPAIRRGIFVVSTIASITLLLRSIWG